MRATPVVALLVLAGTLYVGARPAGPLPALGPLLDPVHGLWSAARAGTPAPAGTVAVPGLGGRVRVVYDRRAVPHIFADREDDAYRALGYVVARDRLFQMYVQTLAGSGRLTELGGARLLGADRETRRLGLPWAAARKVRALDTAGTSWRFAQAYADGVNAYVTHMSAADVPMEFRMLNVAPPRWEPINSVHLLNRMGYTLAYIDPEMDRASAAARVGREAAAALFPDRTPIVEPIQPNGQTAPRFDFATLPPPGAPDTAAATLADALGATMPLRTADRLARADEPSTMASNNWAVAPRRTAGGHALLAGDPHLELTLPSIWYEAHLVVPNVLDVYGVTIPGAPGIIIGFNRDVAWTFTNTGADVIDYYAERIDDPVRPARYMVDGQWRPLERRVETYRDARGGVLGTDTLYFTHRGPMHRQGNRWLSMRWTLLDPSDETAGFQQGAHARTVAEWQTAMASHYWAPAQNMLSADRQGSIAIRSTGHFPVRPGDGSGLKVRDGTLSASDWQGWLPVERYPQAFDPAQGYVASANQQPIDPSQYSGYFGGDFDPWRALRINALLRADSQVTPDAMRRYQTDPGSARADYFAPFFLAAARAPHAGVDAARLTEAARLLAQWDRRYTREDTRAVLFEQAMRELTFRTWDELDDARRGPQKAVGIFGEPSTAPARAVAVPSAVLAELLADSASVWWDVRATAGRRESRDDVLAASLAAALDSVRRKFGAPDAGGWQWGRLRHANVRHLLQTPALSALDLSVQGGPSTLSPSAGGGTHGPSWRMVVELGPEVHAMATYPGGQSGNPLSPGYKDRLARWVAGELDTLFVPRRAADVSAAQTASVLTLVPAR